jgi:hypothetical protein
MQKMEDSILRQLWRLTNVPFRLWNGALTLRDVKNGDRSGYVHENKWGATKCIPILVGFLHENAPIER